MMSSRHPSCIALLALLALFVSACGEDERFTDPTAAVAETVQAAPRARNDNLPRGGEERKVDINDDGRPDQIYVSFNGVLGRVERDFNFDGKADLFEHYDAGQLVEMELDLDLDGEIDVVENFVGGQLASKHYALGFRSKMAVSRFYQGGALVRIERDSNEDGAVDAWEHYEPGASKPSRVEVDTNGDLKPDRTL
mgnify:CR=1 FL=1